MNTDLVVICVTAFGAVFTLLSLLAIAIRLLIMLFPKEIARGIDPATLAAVTSAISAVYPGTKVTKIKEI